MSEWISVEERLPSRDFDGVALNVVVATSRGLVVSETDAWAEGDAGGHFHFWGDKVTHWMPLPEPPK